MQRMHRVATMVVCLLSAQHAAHLAAQAANPTLNPGDTPNTAPENPADTAKQGLLSGVITDPTGARVPGATLHLEGKGGRHDAVTDAVGHFSLRVAAGKYTLSVTASGFDTLHREAIQVSARGHTDLPLTLSLNAEMTEVNVNSADSDGTAAGNNSTAISLSGDKLATFSDDDATFQQQIQAIAGGGGDSDSGGNQLMVDGFSGGRFPPKTAIREIRINSNPFSAQYEWLGFGRIEVFTKPGADTYHGNFSVAGNNQSFNARNPFTGPQPPYHNLYFDADLNGPIGHKTSFFLAGNRTDQQNNAVINAFNPDGTPLSEAVPNPQNNSTFSARLDRQFTANNVLTGRYEWNNAGQSNSGVGLLVLPSEGITSSATTQTLQLGDTETHGASTVIETRFEYVRTRTRQTPNSTAPTLIVQGSFSGGGSPSQTATDSRNHYELQEYISRVFGPHFLRAGGRFRAEREANTSSGGYNGSFTFSPTTVNGQQLSALQAYGITQQGLAQGLSPAAIRAAGGGASQFNLTAGIPSAEVSTDELDAYAEDEWKLHKDLTFNYGLRLESQTAVPDHFDPAPRIALAYAVTPGKRKEPLVVLRSGFGLFYYRFDVGNLLTAVRQNGASQSAYYLQNPDFYPNVPAPTGLPSVEPTTYHVSPDMRTPYNMMASFSVEHSFGSKGNVGVTYMGVRGVHQYLSRNINAPLPGTYNPANPTSGTRPLGGTQNVYQFSSDGTRRSQALWINVDLNPTKRLSVWGFSNLQQREGDTSGSGSFPSNQYNLAQDYGRSAINNIFFVTGTWYNGPKGFNGGLFLRSHSAIPFNITTGTDLNGDTIFNDRPAFATDLTRASVVRTRYGNFDTAPIAGQTIIPVNYGSSPAFATLNVFFAKEFRFGPRPTAEAPPPGQPASSHKPDPRYNLRFSLEAQNVTNHTNASVPVGILNSPFFGKSLSLAETYSGITAANRILTLRGNFSF